MLETSSDPVPIQDGLLHELFVASVDRCPERTAVLCGQARLSYLQLEERANRLARCLRARNVGREDRVAIFLPRSEHVYAAILAVLKAGAAYVPLDPETPVERASFILEDSGAKCLITLAHLADELRDSLPAGLGVLRLDLDAPEIEGMPTLRLSRAEIGTSRESLCYVIYTSGTTGRPKGVMIEHRNATNLVRAESLLYGARPDDRVFQLASVSFDASVEEIWLAFFHGATLVAGTQEILRSGPEFSRILTGLGVTILSCVPTFLSMLEDDIPTLRILILGGEACPAEVVERWHRPGRTIFNTYGPTEATVIATAAVLAPSRRVTIGRPIANYKVFLLGENLEPVAGGAEGEICIAGEGVARGYLYRPELDLEKFVTTDKLTGKPLRLYRTADLARWTPAGELEYLGRADDQIKLRGYRIELSEIEAVLMQCPGVLAAAAAPHRESQRIAAYIVPSSRIKPDRAALRKVLAAKLAPFMMPAFLDELSALPMTSSGKIDRRRLPAPRAALRAEDVPVISARTDAEKTVAAAWAAALGQDGFSVEDDFFSDLDGHSMLAALAVSALRRAPGFERISIADLYAHPTVERLAKLSRQSHSEAPPSFFRLSNTAYGFCAAGQALGVTFLAGLYAWQWLGAFLTYGYLIVADGSVPSALFGALAVYCATTPVMLGLSIALKWLLLGRIRPGKYPLWGWFYWRFWFVRALVRAAPIPYLAGTPLINIYYRLMGARIGSDVFIGSHGLATFDVLTVGDGSSIGADTTLDGASVEGGMLRIAPVTLGRSCWVGNRCSIGGGAELADGAGLDDLSMIPDGARLGAGELWRGSPAAPAGRLAPETSRRPWSAASCLAHVAGVFVVPLVVLAAVFPGLMLITHLGHRDEGFAFLIVAPMVALSFVVFLCAEVWAFKWLLVGRMREGRYPVGGYFYFCKWFFDQLMTLSLEVTGTLYTTLYLRPWLQAMGARVGPRSEISTIRLVDPDLLVAGAECFLADDVLVGAPRVRSGWISIGSVRVGDRAFVGNSAVLPAGSILGDNVLVGTLSIPPEPARGPVADATSWFGSPAIHLPARQKHDGFLLTQTYYPTRSLVALRLFVEFFRIVLPSTLFVVLAALIINVTDVLQDYIGLGEWLATLPVLYIAAGILALLVTVVLKKILIGRYETGEKPLWCAFVWRSELLTGVYENMAVLFFLDLLRGTPFLAWCLRALGVKVGRRCYLDTTWFTEFDLIEIGDEAALNEDANVQTHLFEDRVLKMGRVRIGRRCSVGSMSTVLYDTSMGDGSSLGELSLLMKGESLPDGTRWHGIPAK